MGHLHCRRRYQWAKLFTDALGKCPYLHGRVNKYAEKWCWQIQNIAINRIITPKTNIKAHYSTKLSKHFIQSISPKHEERQPSRILFRGLVEVYRRFRDAYCLHYQDDGGEWWKQYSALKRRWTSTRLHCAITQKAVIFIFATMKTCNLQNMFLEIDFNIIFPFTSIYFKLLPPMMYSTKICIFVHPWGFHAYHTSNFSNLLPWFHFSLTSKYSTWQFVSTHLQSVFFFSEWEYKFYSRTKNRYTVFLYVQIFKFLETKWDDKIPNTLDYKFTVHCCLSKESKLCSNFKIFSLKIFTSLPYILVTIYTILFGSISYFFTGMNGGQKWVYRISWSD
jgi:hypothetical protein